MNGWSKCAPYSRFDSVFGLFAVIHRVPLCYIYIPTYMLEHYNIASLQTQAHTI